MENRFELYMNESTEKICELLSSPDFGSEEKELIVSAFSNELTDSICNTNSLPEYNYIFGKTSASYIDKQLSSVLESNDLLYSDYNDALKLCSRQHDIFCLFEDKKWELPLLNNVNIDYAIDNIKQRRDTNSLINQITAWDSEITDLFSKVCTDPDVKTCSFILQRIDDFDELLDKCKKSGLKCPLINNKNTKKLRNKLSDIRIIAEQKDEIYRRIIATDEQISDRTVSGLNNKANFQEIISLCKTQNSQFQECEKKQFRLPQITVSNPSNLITKYSHFIEMRDLDEEICTTKASLKTRWQYSKFINICNQQERNINICNENNWLIPEISAQHPETLAHDAEAALIKKNKSDKIKAISILIGILIVAIIVCICINTKDISVCFKEWQSTNYKVIVEKIKDEGFSNVELKPIDTLEKEQDNLINNVTVNGKSYTSYNGKRIYTSLNAPVVIYYYTYKIKIDNNNSGFKGQEYTDVVNSLNENGFTNVKTEVVNDGWAKGNSIVEVMVNDTTEYKLDDSFEPNVEIIVKYSSNDRINAEKCVENFRNRKYIDVQNAFKSAGFTNVKVEKKDTFDKSKYYLISSLKINGSEYNDENNKGCFVQKNAPIIIEYYVVRKIEVGGSAKDFKEEEYSSVVSKLKNKGFTNIVLFRNDNLITGLLTKEGSIENITIDGNGNFSATDEFYNDDRIEIVVNTFKNKGCPDITQTID